MMKSFKEFMNADPSGKKGDANSNKWAIGFIISEIAIVVMLVVMFFLSNNYWILFGAIAYFLFSCAVFLRMLDQRRQPKEEEIHEQKKD